MEIVIGIIIGLAIEKLEKDWTEYPVLHLSLAGGKHMEKDQLVRYLLYILKVNEEKFGIVNDSPDPNVRMLNLIKTVYEQTGQKVVVPPRPHAPARCLPPRAKSVPLG